MNDPLGPNTGATSNILRRNVILCGGEDADELMNSRRQLRPNDPPASSFSYRCYKFWTFPGRTLIWTGIGTGCLEPLLWEIFQPGIIKDIILIGTAGRLSNSKLPMGVAGCVNEAYSGCTSIDDVAGVIPLKPRYPTPSHLPTCTAVSSDFYYGFSQRAIDGSYPASASLRTAVDRHLHSRDLVDMETAQFYYFCQTLGQPTLRYLAIRAAANDIAAQEEQLTHTPAALSECLKLAIALQDSQSADFLPETGSA